MTSLFQILQDVIAGGERWLDEGCPGWKKGGSGDNCYRLDSKIHYVSLIKFSPMETIILNLSPAHIETSRLTSLSLLKDY